MILDQFWRRWMKDYVPILAPTLTRQATCQTIACDSIVLLVDPNLPRGQWLMGRIIRLFAGKDGIARVAEVKTNYGLMRKPLVKLIELQPVSTTETGGMLTIQSSKNVNEDGRQYSRT
ncbi:hypothetical protein M514_08692 [Trichuris suis]|uniref:DUF5641 domain-containing protein n=1 Tax=Trichuris suis TaxID=68888 RepID=A0A085LZR9_9BILA|nr:hypothetical protein M513_08692 [Trichuris suis]KFD62353.1 hypothetical protein M514_08692 [Trichuris suis]